MPTRLTDQERILRNVKEDELEANVRDTAHTFGWLYVHWRPARTELGWRTPLSGDSGFPDCTLVKGARLVVAELKRETEKPRPDQVLWLDALAKTDVEVYCWLPRDWNSGEIQEILTVGCLPHHKSRWVA